MTSTITFNDLPTQRSKLSKSSLLALVLAATLIMGAGWGIRGSFGHSRGAMMPGAMLGLTLAACSYRNDWRKRAAILGFLSAIGWGFNGASSYGLLIGYSQGGSLNNSAYGYAGLFLIGALYSGLGTSFLALGLTKPRSFLDHAVLPMIVLYLLWLLEEFTGLKRWSIDLFAKDPATPQVSTWLYNSNWLNAATAIVVGTIAALRSPRHRGACWLVAGLGLGWFAGMFLLVHVADLRINPPRHDAWAGCLGMQAALLIYFFVDKNRAALMLAGYGLIAGGYGFACGEFLQALGRAEWGPVGSIPALKEFGAWTVMEQTFGYIMGFGVSLGIARLIQGRLTPPQEDSTKRLLNPFCVFVLLGPLFAFNFLTNLKHWQEFKLISELTMGVPTGYLLIAVVVMILLLLATALYRQQCGKLDLAPPSPLGKSQLLALLVIWMALAIYVLLPRIGFPTSLMFFAAIGLGTLFILLVNTQSLSVESETVTAASSPAWNLGWKHWILWFLAPVMIWVLATLTMGLKIPIKQFRFSKPEATSRWELPQPRFDLGESQFRLFAFESKDHQISCSS